MITRITAVVLALAAAAAVTAAALHMRASAPQPPARPPSSASLAPSPLATAPARVAGIVTDDLTRFDRTCGCRPGVAVHYIHWGHSISESTALSRIMLRDGSEPLLELEPFGVPPGGIAAGHDDAYLNRLAKAVRSLHAPVLMSFAPEANGNWYESWGYHHVPASSVIAAWRHVVTAFRRDGASNVTWVWVVAAGYPGSEPLGRLWPGAAYVDEVGVDSYFLSPQDTFASVFGPTIASIRQLTNDPVLVTETGASPAAGKARVLAQLASGVSRYGLAGFIWFNIDQAGKRGKADWSIDNDPAALTAFRNTVRSYR
jgi:mannan endo-1,4-beta-mannosidase